MLLALELTLETSISIVLVVSVVDVNSAKEGSVVFKMFKLYMLSFDCKSPGLSGLVAMFIFTSGSKVVIPILKVPLALVKPDIAAATLAVACKVKDCVFDIFIF